MANDAELNGRPESDEPTSRCVCWPLLRLLPLALTVVVGLGFSIGLELTGHQPAWLEPLLLASAGLISVPAVARLAGWRRTGIILAAMAIFSISAESLGAAGGLPYGIFHYTDRLGPKAFGLAPWVMTLAWPPFLMAGVWIRRQFRRPALGLTLGALTVVTADLLLDPGAVRAGYWYWESAGIWHGIPLSNYIGWAAMSLVGIAAVSAALPKGRLPLETAAGLVAIVSYWTGFALQWPAWSLATIGGLVMAWIGWLAYRQVVESNDLG